jgi:hypothetical protein
VLGRIDDGNQRAEEVGLGLREAALENRDSFGQHLCPAFPTDRDAAPLAEDNV